MIIIRLWLDTVDWWISLLEAAIPVTSITIILPPDPPSRRGPAEVIDFAQWRADHRSAA